MTARQLEVRPGDTVFVSVGEDGETHMHYMRPSSYHNLDAMCSAFEQYLRGCGFSFDGRLDFVDDDGDTQWAVDVRNFLDELTDPEGYGHAVSEEIVKEAARLRDA
jgi:hypothetical protein